MKTICFTGFVKGEKVELITLAEANGFFVKNDVAKDLSYLCCGPNAGPSKINKAKSNGSLLISDDEFKVLVSKFVNASPKISDLDTSLSLPVTIHDAHPLLDYLWDATDSGKKISIYYHGGSRSGSLREIVPLSISENFVLRAVDFIDKRREVKSFSINNIEISGIDRLLLPVSESPKKKIKKQYSVGKFQNIGDVHRALGDTLEGMGWHVSAYEKDGVCVRLDVCDYFKNGKPRKTPVVTLYFEPENKTRPYVCKCRGVELAITYTNLDNAVLTFLELAFGGYSPDSDETSYDRP